MGSQVKNFLYNIFYVLAASVKHGILINIDIVENGKTNAVIFSRLRGCSFHSLLLTEHDIKKPTGFGNDHHGSPVLDLVL